ncbi:MAG: hypothetical protein AAF823_08035 [Planctomycetota bacterium]
MSELQTTDRQGRAARLILFGALAVLLISLASVPWVQFESQRAQTHFQKQWQAVWQIVEQAVDTAPAVPRQTEADLDRAATYLETALQAPRLSDTTVELLDGTLEKRVVLDGPWPFHTEFLISPADFRFFGTERIYGPDMPWPLDVGHAAGRIAAPQLASNFAAPLFLGPWLGLAVWGFRSRDPHRSLLFALATAYLLVAAAVFAHQRDFTTIDLAETHPALSWTLLALFATAAVAVYRRLKRPPPAGRCIQCGYDLRENRSGRCPECGTAIPQAPPTAA